MDHIGALIQGQLPVETDRQVRPKPKGDADSEFDKIFDLVSEKVEAVNNSPQTKVAIQEAIKNQEHLAELSARQFQFGFRVINQDSAG